jgi:serine/threonine protein kinase
MKERESLAPEEALEILVQVLHGFEDLLRKNIIHRDLKPANILVRGGVFKLGDFGLAKKVALHESSLSTSAGTP